MEDFIDRSQFSESLCEDLGFLSRLLKQYEGFFQKKQLNL